MKRFPIAVAVLGLLIAALAACGEKEEPTEDELAASATTAPEGEGGGADREPEATEGRPVVSAEAAVRRAVAGALGGDTTDACETYVTARFVRSAYGGPGGCRGAQGAGAEFEVALGRVDVGGTRATATARPADGPYEGDVLEVTLVGEDNRWRVDELDADIPPGP